MLLSGIFLLVRFPEQGGGLFYTAYPVWEPEKVRHIDHL